MTNTKLLIAINKNLQNCLTNINNLNDCINKHCWHDIIEDLMKDVTETLKIENMKTNK